MALYIKKLLAVTIMNLFALSLSTAQNTRNLSIESVTCVHVVTFNDQCDPIVVSGTLFNPKTPTDAVVIVVHGSQGVDERHLNYAKHINRLGFSAFILDSWTARGVGKAQFDFAANERKGARSYNQAIDALRAAEVLASQPEYFKKFGHIGESSGGTAAIWLTKPYLYREYSRLFSQTHPKINANVALYAGCFERIDTDKFLPIETLFLSGELDNDTPAAHCERFSNWMNTRGGRTSFVALKGQHHDFDAPYKLHQASRAQNPSDCSSLITGSIRTWDKTGEQFPMTPQGYRDFQRKCIRTASDAPVMTGHIEGPSTGFKVWGDFFVKVLGAP